MANMTKYWAILDLPHEERMKVICCGASAYRDMCAFYKYGPDDSKNKIANFRNISEYLSFAWQKTIVLRHFGSELELVREEWDGRGLQNMGLLIDTIVDNIKPDDYNCNWKTIERVISHLCKIVHKKRTKGLTKREKDELISLKTLIILENM